MVGMGRSTAVMNSQVGTISQVAATGRRTDTVALRHLGNTPGSTKLFEIFLQGLGVAVDGQEINLVASRPGGGHEVALRNKFRFAGRRSIGNRGFAGDENPQIIFPALRVPAIVEA